MTVEELFEAACKEAGIPLPSRWSKKRNDFKVFAAGLKMAQKHGLNDLTATTAEVYKDEAMEGWKEATIAWTVCGSIHKGYCGGKDPLFTTRQQDFLKHEGDARARYHQLEKK